MTRCRTMLIAGLTLAVLALLTLATSSGVHAAGIEVGNGHSILADGEKAGTEAAEKAKAALGETEAKVVLVFDSVEGGAKGKEAMLKGVASVFDASITYGCAAYAPITQDCNTGTVAVLALGGDVRIAPAVAEVGGDHAACGKKIGAALKAVAVPEDAGRVVLLFGACHVPKNNDLVGGVCSVLGEKFPVAGAAAMGDLLYYQGKVLPQSNLGLMLIGDFTCSFAAKNAPASEKERVIAVAGEAAAQAVGDKKATLVLAFDCGGRRGQMGGEIDKELAGMCAAIGDAPLFGFYGSGETGPADNDSAPKGVGYHIIICAILGK
ncbi:MAG: FIST C-terminal domain-containing protein [Candidatus Nealsonbacteria bacterium]|nr:FIST C-terminal domain-containing protein [Candidatus Nealsonbacteria bacterium]